MLRDTSTAALEASQGRPWGGLGGWSGTLFLNEKSMGADLGFSEWKHAWGADLGFCLLNEKINGGWSGFSFLNE